MIFGPLANLALWAVATQWYFPHKLPLAYGLRYWADVFKPGSDAFAALGTSIVIAIITVIVCLLLAYRQVTPCRVPAAVARRDPLGPVVAGRRSRAWRSTSNIARLFYTVGLNGTIAGVVLVHAVHAW